MTLAALFRRRRPQLATCTAEACYLGQRCPAPHPWDDAPVDDDPDTRWATAVCYAEEHRIYPDGQCKECTRQAAWNAVHRENCYQCMCGDECV